MTERKIVIPGEVIAFEVSEEIVHLPIRTDADPTEPLPVDKPEEAFK